MYPTVLGYEKTTGLGQMLQKIGLVGHFGISTGQCISIKMKVEIVSCWNKVAKFTTFLVKYWPHWQEMDPRFGGIIDFHGYQF